MPRSIALALSQSLLIVALLAGPTRIFAQEEATLVAGDLSSIGSAQVTVLGTLNGRYTGTVSYDSGVTLTPGLITPGLIVRIDEDGFDMEVVLAFLHEGIPPPGTYPIADAWNAAATGRSRVTGHHGVLLGRLTVDSGSHPVDLTP